MNKQKLSAKERTDIESAFATWQKDEIHDLQLTVLPQNQDELIYNYRDELKGTINLMEALVDVCYLDDKKAFDFLNRAFASYMDYRAKIGLLMRGDVESEISDFSCITNVIHATFMNKKALIKMHSHYQGLKYDIDKLIRENEEADRAESENHRERNYHTETLSQ